MRRGVSSVIVGAMVIFLIILTAITILFSMRNETISYGNIAKTASNKIHEELNIDVNPNGSILITNNWGKSSKIISIQVVSKSGDVLYYKTLDEVVQPYSEVQIYIPEISKYLSSGDNYLFLVTDLGNVFWESVGSAGATSTTGASFGGGDSISIGNNTLTLSRIINETTQIEFVKPYHLMIQVGDVWYQIYMGNLSIVRSGAYGLFSLDRKIYVTKNSMFVNGKYVNPGYGYLIGIGYDYAIWNVSVSNYTIYYSNGTTISFVESSPSNFVFSNNSFWFYNSTIKLTNGTFLHSWYVSSDNYRGFIYIKFWSDSITISRFLMTSSLNDLYLVISDGDLLYSVSMIKSGTYNGHTVYSVQYVGSIGKQYEPQAITGGNWIEDALLRNSKLYKNLTIGYSDNYNLYTSYFADTYWSGAPTNVVGSIGLHAWQNQSSTPFSYFSGGVLRYSGGQLNAGDIIWIRYAVIDKKALSAYNAQSNYTVTYNIEVRLEGTTSNYIINATIKSMHGDDTYSIYPTGWLITYVIKEESGLVEKQKHTFTLNYYRASYANYPIFTRFIDNIGIMRYDANTMHIYIFNKWIATSEMDVNKTEIILNTVNEALSLRIIFRMMLDSEAYPAILDWPTQHIVASLFIHEISIKRSNGMFYIGPVKEGYTTDTYYHYFDYQHTKDVVAVNSDKFGNKFWSSPSYAIVVASPSNYPAILQGVQYKELSGLSWSQSVTNFPILDGYPGVYKITGGLVTRLDWITDAIGDYDYTIYMYGDYLVIVSKNATTVLYIYDMNEL